MQILYPVLFVQRNLLNRKKLLTQIKKVTDLTHFRKFCDTPQKMDIQYLNSWCIFQATDKFHTVKLIIKHINYAYMYVSKTVHKSLRAFNIVPITSTINLIATTISN